MTYATISNLREPSYLRREAINELKTNIEFSGDNIKSLLFTSCAPNEGKTTVSFDLAKSLAIEGKTVCFLDADLRKSVFTSRFRIDSRDGMRGLTHMLTRENEFGDPICKTNIPGLDVIFAGRVVQDPTAMLKSNRMDVVLSTLRGHYDYLIIDIAPLGSVIDAAILAPKCDGTVLVVADNETSGRDARRVVEQLKRAGANILGVVMNKVPIKRADKYNYYYSANSGKKKKKK